MSYPTKGIGFLVEIIQKTRTKQRQIPYTPLLNPFHFGIPNSQIVIEKS